MDENQNSLQTHYKIENSYMMQQLSDGLQRIAINQIDYQYGLSISESCESMISINNNNDFKVTDNHLNEECEFKNVHHASKDTDLNMLLDFGEDMEIQISDFAISNNQVDAKALKKGLCSEENQQDNDIQNNKYDYCESALAGFSGHADDIQNRSYQSYSNLINRYCYKCKLVSKNIIDCKCYNCQSSLQFQCKKCGSLYKNYIAVLSHIKYECYKLPTFYCPICCYTTYCKINLLNHKQIKHSPFDESEFSHQCSMCKKKFKEQQSMLRHEKMCKPNLVCQHCPYRTKLHQLLTQHIQKRHQQYITKNHKCPDCNKKYRDLKTLHLHMKFTCSVKKFFQCDYCHFKTDRKFSLAKHVQEVHRLSMKESIL